MSFLTPIYLLGLLAIAIPIILHLINFRKPQKQRFSTLIFFKQLQRSSMKRLKLKKRLLLALRIALLALLAMALARPAMAPGTGFGFQSGSVLYMVLLENGPAMNQIDERGPLMSTANRALETLITNADSDDRFLIYNTHGPLMMPQELGPEQANALLEDIEATNAGNFTAGRLDQLLRRAESSDRDHRSMYVIARGADNITLALQDFEPSFEFNPELVPVTLIRTGGTPGGNLGITEIRPANSIIAAGRPAGFEVEVQNFGTEPVFNYTLSMEAQGELAGQYQLDLPPGESQSFSFELLPPESGSLSGRAILEGDPLSFDNERYFTLDLPETRSITLVQPEEQGENSRSWLRPVFEAAQRSAGRVSLNEMNWNELIQQLGSAQPPNAVLLEGVGEIPEFAWDGLSSFIQQGGGLLLFPGESGTPEQLNQFLEQINAGRYTGLIGDPGRFESVARVDRLVRGHPVLDDIFDATENEEIRLELPQIYHYWRYDTGGGSAAQRILSTNLGDPLLVEHSFGQGKIFVSAIHSSPGWSDFSVNPLFAPVFFRLGLFAASGEDGGLNQFTLGQDFEWIKPGSNPQNGARIKLNDLVVAPDAGTVNRGVRIRAETQEWKPGLARISMNDDSLTVAVNQHNRESVVRLQEDETYLETFESFIHIDDVVTLEGGQNQISLARQLGGARSGSEFWHWLIAIGLLCLLGESYITKKLGEDHS